MLAQSVHVRREVKLKEREGEKLIEGVNHRAKKITVAYPGLGEHVTARTSNTHS